MKFFRKSKKESGGYRLVKWNHLGHPISVNVEGLEDVSSGYVPTIEEMSGLIDDFTDGKSLKDHMEELRNEPIKKVQP